MIGVGPVQDMEGVRGCRRVWLDGRRYFARDGDATSQGTAQKTEETFSQPAGEPQRAIFVSPVNWNLDGISSRSEKFTSRVAQTLFESLGQIFRRTDSPVDPSPRRTIMCVAFLSLVNKGVAADA